MFFFSSAACRRRFLCLCALLLACLLLVGCGSQPPEPTAAPETVSPQQPTPPAAPEPTPEPLPEVELLLQKRAFLLGDEIAPEDLLAPDASVEDVELRFAEEPDPSSRGEQKVTVIASFHGKDLAESSVEILLCDDILELELKEGGYYVQHLRLMVKRSDIRGYGADFKYFRPEGPGVYLLPLHTYVDTQKMIGLVVRDTTPPTAKAVPTECFLDAPRDPASFVTKVKDLQAVEIAFRTEPDWSTEGTRNVDILLTDASGNETVIPVPVTFKRDDVPPEITVSLKPYRYVGESVAYLKGATAFDNVDGECELSVDKSQVKYWQVGTYPVTYTASDKNGNTAEKTVKISFREPGVGREDLDELVDKIFDEIMTDDMSTAEQARAIYRYIHKTIRYSGSSDKSDWLGAAYAGLTQHHGDCFTFFAVSKVMLSRIDCETADVQRIDGRTNHYWLLVNLGTGWYHFDTTPNRINVVSNCFMRTDQELHRGRGSYFWKYDKSTVPEVATEKFEMF